MLTKVDKLVCGAGVQPVRGGECDDDGEAGDQQEDDGDLQGTTGVIPLVIHLENFSVFERLVYLSSKLLKF